jgi:dipeptidyl aminopeptidase/acylaminoacyl peptidase
MNGLVRIVAVAVVAAACFPAQARLLELDDLGTLVGVWRHSLSPDGKRVAMVTQRLDYVGDRVVSSLVIVDVATGAATDLTPGRHGIGTPRWSPGGERIAWLDAEESGASQIYVADFARGAAIHRRVTDAAGGVGSFKWSPDGRQFAFTTADPPLERGGEERRNRSFEAGEGDYLATSAPTSSHVWIVPAGGGEARRLTSGKHSVMDLEWLRDGRIALTTQPSPNAADYVDQSIEFVGVADGARSIAVSESKAILMDNPLSLSPDGSLLAFCRPRGPGRETDNYPENISVVPTGGGPRRDATPQIDRDIIAMAWLPDGRGFLAAAADATRFGLWLQPLGGAPRRLELGDVATLWELSVSRTGVITMVGSEPHHPPEIYVKTSLDARPERLTRFNEHLAGLDRGKIETVRWHSEGFEHSGVLFHPPGPRKAGKLPMVVNIHGGPSQPSSEGWHWQEDGFNRVMAARGWLVFTPNYRGTGSSGLAYQSAIVNDAGAGPGRDVMAGIAAVKAAGMVDEHRVAVSGFSYGGLMTVWLTAHYPGWRAAVAGAAVTDNFDWYNLADYNVAWGLGMNGSPWLNGNAENYWEQSPIAHAHRIRTPTLIISGTRDRRVTITQSYKLYHALKDNGVPVQFIAYPDSEHAIAEPVHERDAYRRWMGWIDRHFSGSGGDSAVPLH